MSDTVHPADTISFETLCEIIETDYTIREQEGHPVPSGSDEMFYMAAHSLRKMLRLAIDINIIENGRATFPIPQISAFAADEIRRAETDEINGIGYWDRIDLPARGSMARVLRDRMNVALGVLSRKFRIKTLPQPTAEQAAFWTEQDQE